MKTIPKILVVIVSAILLSCGNNNDSTTATGTNYLTMKINGVEWKSDTQGVFGAYHPSGYNDATIISGTIGEGASQQAFNITMYRTSGVGEYVFSNSTESVYAVDKNVAQLANLNPQDYLYGGLLGVYNMKVKLKKVATSPAVVEATFEGTLTGVHSNVITITEGKFYYQE